MTGEATPELATEASAEAAPLAPGKPGVSSGRIGHRKRELDPCGAREPEKTQKKKKTA